MLSAVLATVLAIHLGFGAVIGMAVVLYGVAGWLGSLLLRAVVQEPAEAQRA